MPTVSYSLKIYLPKLASIFCLNRVFLLKAETYSHASTLLFIYDAVIRELAQDTVGPCLVPSSAPEGMTLLPYSDGAPELGVVLHMGFFFILSSLLGSKMLQSDWVGAAAGASVTFQLNG